MRINHGDCHLILINNWSEYTDGNSKIIQSAINNTCIIHLFHGHIRHNTHKVTCTHEKRVEKAGMRKLSVCMRARTGEWSYNSSLEMSGDRRIPMV